LVEDGDLAGAAMIADTELAPQQYRHTECIEVLWRDSREMDVFVCLGLGHKTWNLDDSATAAASQGIRGGPTSRTKSQDLPDSIKDISLHCEPFGTAA